MAADTAGPDEPGQDDAFFREFFEHAPDMCASTRTDLAKIHHCNQTLCGKLGWTCEQLIGADIYSIYHPDCHDEVKRISRKLLTDGQAASDALVLLTRRGERIPVSLRAIAARDRGGQLATAHCTWREVNESQALELMNLDLRLRSAQKTESVALLTSSVAHDFNNLLVTMIGNADLGKRSSTPGSMEYTKFRDIGLAAKQAADLTRQLLTYSVSRADKTDGFELNETVTEIAQLLEVAIAKRATLHCELQRAPIRLWGDVAQIRQVIMNLVVNSADAVNSVNGQIVLRTGTGHFSRNALMATRVGECLRAGEYGFIEVTDNGVGLTEEQQGRMFDPFFTSKSTGHGLGLAALLSIVRTHGGTVSVSSQLGRGTAIKVLLPIATRAARAKDQPVSARRVRGEHVLVVDDEQLVRGTARRLLESEGFTVTECADGAEAVALYDAIGDTVDVVLMDLRMPRCDGMTAYRSLRARSDNQRVVLMSGLDAVPRSTLDDDHALSFLQKPFEGHTLVESVLDALSAD